MDAMIQGNEKTTSRTHYLRKMAPADVIQRPLRHKSTDRNRTRMQGGSLDWGNLALSGV